MYIVPSGEFRFEWDLAKAARNARKHGVSFDEAQGVFFDERELLLDDLSVGVTINGSCSSVSATHCGCSSWSMLTARRIALSG